jgi:CheY-like chemotaxis protein
MEVQRRRHLFCSWACVAMRQPATRNATPAKVVTPKVDALPDDSAGTAGRILLLEDRDDFREILRDYLVSRRFQVASVPGGVEGLKEVTKDAFDIVLCDMMMPGLGGEMFYWAVTRIRPATAKRFIFFTGHRNNPAIEFFFQRVNATVLMKPFPLKTLDSKIRERLCNLAEIR